mgnify:CR=1 FL=1
MFTSSRCLHFFLLNSLYTIPTPAATNFWTPEPDIYTGAEAWILAGGAHHTAFTYDLTAEQMGDWAAAMGIEAVYIDKDTKIRDFKRDLMLGEVFYR